VLVRDGRHVTVCLDGERTPELAGEGGVGEMQPGDRLFVGGRSDGDASFEGKICEVAIYNRALSADVKNVHWRAAHSALTSSAEHAAESRKR
jgi:hypothetical protein